jgi:hypothetical protein
VTMMAATGGCSGSLNHCGATCLRLGSVVDRVVQDIQLCAVYKLGVHVFQHTVLKA